MTAITTVVGDTIESATQKLVDANGSVAAAKTAAATLVTNASSDAEAQFWYSVRSSLFNTVYVVGPTYSNTYSNAITYPTFG